jgi:flagellar basal body-associated protein FliL
MAEDEEDPQEVAEEEPEPKKSRKGLLFGGGAVAVVAAGAIAAMMAVPSKHEARRLTGPYSVALFEKEFSCNIEEAGRTRYLQMQPQAAYFAYDATYMQTRSQDELYAPALHNTVFQIASRKTMDEIYGSVNESTFMEELRDALDPVLFPVHIGETELPWDFDEVSGLRPGLSSDKNTFRGEFDQHLLHVDAATQTIWIDEGPKTTFEPGDFDVRVISPEGGVVFVDTSNLEEGFQGAVQIGVRGRIMRILPNGLLIQ